MYNLLNNLMEEKTLTAFYTNRDESDKFSVGYVYALETDTIIIINIGIHGEFDGFTLERIEDIFKIETDTLYLRKIKMLLDCDVQSQNLEITGELLEDILKYAKNNNHIVMIRIEGTDDSIVGFVLKISDTIISVKQINEYGEYDGICLFYRNEINRVMMKDVECILLEKLIQK